MPLPLPLQSVNHIARVICDLEASRAFYQDILGFRPIKRPDFAFPGAWLFNYGVQIHLIATKPAEEPVQGQISTRADHVAFHVPDIKQVENLLKQHGIPYASNHVKQTGVHQLFFHDPDGNHIEVGTYPPVQELPEETLQ